MFNISTTALIAGSLALGLSPSAHAAFPGTNGQIVYVVGSIHSGSSVIFAVSAAGGDERPLTTSGGAFSFDPVWTADGQNIWYSTQGRNNPMRYLSVMRADGSGKRRIEVKKDGAAIDARHPSPSPDGTKVAFVHHDDQHSEIWVMAADGSNARALTHSASQGFVTRSLTPTWSPDGREIAFFSTHKGDANVAIPGVEFPELKVMSADGSNQRTVFNPIKIRDKVFPPQYSRPPLNHQPSDTYHVTHLNTEALSWSPSGKEIAFAVRNNVFESDGKLKESYKDTINFANADGTERPGNGTLVETESFNLGSPAYSPDGHRVVFVKEGQITIAPNLFAPRNGALGPAVPLTSGEPKKSQPNWQPIAAAGGH